ncbi:MAG: LysM peptidoglycan-binding domain-containing protein [Boseongicola sp. SB0677_bin_26]|nr:LysM peptidoglycan-binding domain-containing protein [Boseongicola sp. SB0677_bin_26]
MPPVVLADAQDGQTNQAFEAHVGSQAPRAPVTKPAESCSHVVVAGDTLGSIAAARLGTSRRWPEIRAANPGVTPERLRIGSNLKLPCTVTDGAGEGGAGAPPARTAFLERLRGSLAATKTETAATSGSEAVETDAPEGKPHLPPPPVWTAAQGEFLSDVLTRWGTAAGWTVIVDTTDAWKLAVAFRTQAAFDSAVAELIRGMGHDGVPPRVRLYPNQVLRLGGPL